MPIFMLKFSLKLSLHHRLVRVVAQSRKEFMTIGYRQSRIFLFRHFKSGSRHDSFPEDDVAGSSFD